VSDGRLHSFPGAPDPADRELADALREAMAPIDAATARCDVAARVRARLEASGAAPAPRAVGTPASWYAVAAAFAAGALLAVHVSSPTTSGTRETATAASSAPGSEAPRLDVSFRKVDGGVEVVWDGGAAHQEVVVRKCTTIAQATAPAGMRCSPVARVRGGRWLDTTSDPQTGLVFYVLDRADSAS